MLFHKYNLFTFFYANTHNEKNHYKCVYMRGFFNISIGEKSKTYYKFKKKIDFYLKLKL